MVRVGIRCAHGEPRVERLVEVRREQVQPLHEIGHRRPALLLLERRRRALAQLPLVKVVRRVLQRAHLQGVVGRGECKGWWEG